ncbi:hypothetical protein CTI12_AA149240 [Artemisia annua]|uniref:Uncharacterized protein n=1 Tax=Artemisia annua TaxID=35608 RepID=A0A2U1NYM6_ARTAN|nr:hypothetical protein CTI12_AA149240 [Artemisia annua]
MVNAYPPLPEDEDPIDGPTVAFVQQLKREMKIRKLTKSALKRARTTEFDILRNSFTSSIEYEYHIKNIARAMSDKMDSLNPE